MSDVTPEQIVEDLKTILVDELYVDMEIDKIQGSDQLAAGIGLDSVGLMELVALVEEKYGITIEGNSDAPEHERTLLWFATYVAGRVNEKQAGPAKTEG